MHCGSACENTSPPNPNPDPNPGPNPNPNHNPNPNPEALVRVEEANEALSVLKESLCSLLQTAEDEATSYLLALSPEARDMNIKVTFDLPSPVALDPRVGS